MSSTVNDPATASSRRAARQEQQRKRGALRRVKAELRRRRRSDAIPRPAAMGWNVPGGGWMPRWDVPPEFRAPSLQVCGLYPFSVGGSLTMLGAAMGRSLEGRGVVCADPITWFIYGLINNPSAFVLARPGLGKSSLIRHILAQMPDKGIIPMALSDLKPDYVRLTHAMNGQVFSPGRGADSVNPLDMGPLVDRLHELPDGLRRKAWEDLRGRRGNAVGGLCELMLDRPLERHEANCLNRALRLWDEEHDVQVPVISDIRAYVESRHPALRAAVQDRSDDDLYYDRRVEGLVDALIALDVDGEMGDVFALPTTTHLEMNRPLCFDLSAMEGQDRRLQAGLQLVCWTYGSSAVAAAKYLAEADLSPRRTYILVFDELWRCLRAADFMVDRVDELTRLNRTLNISQILCTHTMDDLVLSTPDATKKAFGFVSRSEMVFLGGLAPSEMGNLAEVFAMSTKEQELLQLWSAPGQYNPETNKEDPPPGRGKFLLKVGKSVGTPFQVELVPIEKDANDTNTSWKDTAASMRRSGVGLDEMDRGNG